jgi:flagellar biogenesis protein FliO
MIRRRLAAIIAGSACGGSLAIATQALAQTLGQGTGAEVTWWRVAGALALCLALAVGGAFALRTRMRGTMPIFSAGRRQLQLVETLRLSHQVDVCLFTCNDRQFIIAATPHGAVVVAGGELPPQAPGS